MYIYVYVYMYMYIYIYICVCGHIPYHIPSIRLKHGRYMYHPYLNKKTHLLPNCFFPPCGAISGVSWLLLPALRKTMRCMSRSVRSCDLHLLVDTFGGSYSPDTSYKYVKCHKNGMNNPMEITSYN